MIYERVREMGLEFKSIEEELIYNIFNKHTNVISDNENQTVGSEGLIIDNFNLNNLNIKTLEKTYINSSFRTITSFNKRFSVLVKFVKKVQRKLLKWYIEPITIQQTDFNGAVLNIEKGNQYILSELIKENAQLNANYKKSINILENRLNEIEKIQKILNQNSTDVAEKLNALDELNLSIFDASTKSFWDKKTLSQSGEDAIISFATMALKIPLDKTTYLDLGANHAKELSNTFFFYNNGARGVLVEANPNLIPELKFYRSEDIILNKCISTVNNEKVPFYIINGDGLSTLDKNSADEALEKNPNLEITEIVNVETITVNTIMEKYFGKAPIILNIDLEGIEMEVLSSINFEKYRPLIIVTEMIPYETHLVIEKKNTDIINFMNDKGYIEYAFSGINSIFLDKSQVEELI